MKNLVKKVAKIFSKKKQVKKQKIEVKNFIYDGTVNDYERGFK